MFFFDNDNTLNHNILRQPCTTAQNGLHPPEPKTLRRIPSENLSPLSTPTEDSSHILGEQPLLGILPWSLVRIPTGQSLYLFCNFARFLVGEESNTNGYGVE